MSLGEDRVRINPSASDNATVGGLVEELKWKSANLINICDEAGRYGSDDKEHRRLWALAMTAYEEAAMWAVKAATF